jgi:hypothetical protein
MHWLIFHPWVSIPIAGYLFSNFVDALKLVPPKPTDNRLYVFLYALLMGLAGNAVTLLRHFFPQFLSPDKNA